MLAQAEVPPDPLTHNAFEDINLGGDTPQLDLDFGPDSGAKGSGGGFGFGAGGWGSSWNTGDKWNFGGIGNGAADITDSKDVSGATDDVSSWSFGKKTKKTTTTSGFDFDFATLNEGGETQAKDANNDQDDWGTGFTAAGKKSKNKKKNAVEDISNATGTTAIGAAVTEPTTVDDSWSAWGTSASKKNQSKKKKNDIESIANDTPPIPPPPPPPAEPPADDWSSFGIKGKKKNKKGAVEEPVKVEEPIVSIPEPEPEVDLGWSAFGTKKGNKKGKKDAVDDRKPEADPVVEVGDAEAELKSEADFGWGFSSKKDKKKGKKGADEDKSQDPAVAETFQKTDEVDLGWGGFAPGKKDKKKGKKDTVEEEKASEPAVTVVPNHEPAADLGWGGFGAKKEKKKGKKAVEEVEPKDDDIVALDTDLDPNPIISSGWGNFGTKKDKKSKSSPFDNYGEESHIVEVPEPDPVMEDSFSAGWGTTTKKGKKDKKGGITEVKDDIISVVGSTAATESAGKVADDDWMNWGSDKKKDKKGKKGQVEAKKEEVLPTPPPPPPPPAPSAPDMSSTDIWGSTKKDKKGKKGKIPEPEPAIIEVPEPPPAEKEDVIEDDWGTFGLSAKDKKKKEKEKQKKEQEERAKKEMEELEKKELEEAEKKAKEEKEKDKIKPGKKGKAGTVTAASKTKDLMDGSFPDVPPAIEDDFSTSIWGSSNKDGKKKGSKKDNAFDVPPPVPTPPAQGLTPPPEEDLNDFLDDGWGSFGTAKNKNKTKTDTQKPSKVDESKLSKSISKNKAEEEQPKVESAAKAAKSFWGGMTAPAASKPKTTKGKELDKAKKELELDADLDPDEIVEIIEEEPPPKKGSKAKTGDSKFAKAGSKEEKANKTSASDKKAKADAEIDALIDFDDLDAIDHKSKTADTTTSKGDDKKADAWSFWGSSKKTSGKKGDEPKKEINKQEATNKVDALAFLSNDPEPSPFADEPAPFQPSKSSKSAMSASKTSGKLSVAQKVKALEEEKKKALEKSLEPLAPPTLPDPEIETPPAKKTSAISKSKASPAAKAASASKKKDLFSPVEEEKEKSRDSVPGSFPGEGYDEENLIDMLASTPVQAKKPTKKGAKTAQKEPPKDIDMDVEVPLIPAAPPTPPAEPITPKPAKKERARVVRDQGASSWGFWGATPKKDEKKTVKAKDDGHLPPTKKTATPALVRSKSTKTTKEKDKDTEKSSTSDTKEKKAESRPAKSRGSSFGAFFGGPPPARTKPIRRTSTSAASKTASNRQSMDIDAFGLPSPPPEVAPAATGKAAKVMGTASGKLDRKASSKGKQKAAVVPDPYPIDDDDMVMVNGIEDPIVDAPVPKTSGNASKAKATKNKPKKDSKPFADVGEDIIMVDGPSQEEPEVLAFDEKPKDTPPLRRSTTSAKKPQNGKLMGIFGGFGKTRRNSDTFERPRTKAAFTDDEGLSPRKRTVNSREDSSKRIRRDDRKVRRSHKPEPNTETFITDALNEGGAATELDEVRRQERRAKREGRDTEDRRARRRDAEKDTDDYRKAKPSDRRTKRGEDRPPKESIERSKHSSSRPHNSDRRRSHMEPASTDDRPKAHRSRTEQSSRKRQSVAADGAIDDYFDSRNAPAEGARNEPYMHGANDHTSSWVKSQISDPADPPPLEGTVIEPAPELGGKGGYERGDGDAQRAARKTRRQSRYGVEEDVGETDRERRRRRKEKGSEGSAEWGGREREKPSRRYTDMGGARGAVDGRPSLGAAGKRGSWLKKVAGLGM